MNVLMLPQRIEKAKNHNPLPLQIKDCKDISHPKSSASIHFVENVDKYKFVILK